MHCVSLERDLQIALLRAGKSAAVGIPQGTLNAADAIRFLEHEATYCRDRDASEAFCLLLPALLKVLKLPPMNGHEADHFRREFKKSLHQTNGTDSHFSKKR